MNQASKDSLLGKIVHYVLSIPDVVQINARRSQGKFGITSNSVGRGTEYPLLVTAFIDNKYAAGKHGINGQVLLDGSDTLWVTGRGEGTGDGTWHYPEIVPPAKVETTDQAGPAVQKYSMDEVKPLVVRPPGCPDDATHADLHPDGRTGPQVYRVNPNSKFGYDCYDLTFTDGLWMSGALYSSCSALLAHPHTHPLLPIHQGIDFKKSSSSLTDSLSMNKPTVGRPVGCPNAATHRWMDSTIVYRAAPTKSNGYQLWNIGDGNGWTPGVHYSSWEEVVANGGVHPLEPVDSQEEAPARRAKSVFSPLYHLQVHPTSINVNVSFGDLYLDIPTNEQVELGVLVARALDPIISKFVPIPV